MTTKIRGKQLWIYQVTYDLETKNQMCTDWVCQDNQIQSIRKRTLSGKNVKLKISEDFERIAE